MTELLKFPVEFNGVKNELRFYDTGKRYVVEIGGWDVLTIERSGKLYRPRFIGAMIGIELDSQCRIKKTPYGTFSTSAVGTCKIQLMGEEYELKLCTGGRDVELRSNDRYLLDITRYGIHKYSNISPDAWPKKALNKDGKIKWKKL